MKQANQNRHLPHFVLLDEMNLARVEYYFSDLLSLMETKRRDDNGRIISDPVIEREETGKLTLPDNVYFVGTVNMDETTHPFSKKVLDRANTIEYNEVVLNHFDFLAKEHSEQVEPKSIRNKQLAARFLTLKDAYPGNEEMIHKTTEKLMEINRYLEPIQAQFAYRVRDEICFYMIYNEQAGLLDRDTAFDYQLLQKILPRIAGNDVLTEKVLQDLFQFCTGHYWEDNRDLEHVLAEARYPKSAKKIAHMIRKNQVEGFTSFWNQ